jgi:hypothetical protein
MMAILCFVAVLLGGSLSANKWEYPLLMWMGLIIDISVLLFWWKKYTKTEPSCWFLTWYGADLVYSFVNYDGSVWWAIVGLLSIVVTALRMHQKATCPCCQKEENGA